MDRLTKKLKKGGYSANRHSEAELQERLDQLLGVHQYWLEQVQEMERGIGQASDMGPEGDLSLMMLKAGYNAIVRIGRRFEQAHPMADNQDDLVTRLGKLEDLYEACLMEQEEVREGLDECKDRGYTDDFAYNELMTTKLGLTELIKRFEIAVGEREDDPDPHRYWPEEVRANDQ